MDAELISEAFVDLADTLVADFDIIDFLHVLTDRSVQLLSASAAGVLLVGSNGELQAVAASNEAAGLVELFQIQNDQGPCLDCVRTGLPVTAADLQGQDQRWPRFAAAAVSAGFRTVQALPMRLRDEVVGALNLFGAGTACFSSRDLRVGQAMADVATIGLLQARSVRRSEIAAEQLQGALNSRIIIEQAKGKLAERLSIDMDLAFGMLNGYARNSNQRLTDVARNFVDSATADFPPVARQSRG
jgi:transcriptional regulator with GAF, ATPase, and Fis domain